MTRGRKSNRPAAPSMDVSAMTPRQKILLLGKAELTKLKKTWAAVLSDPQVTPERAREFLGRKLPYYDLPPAATGRPQDPELRAASKLYIVTVENKDWIRSQGYGGLSREQGEGGLLSRIAKECFPKYSGLDEEGRADLLERIKDAVKYRRKKARA